MNIKGLFDDIADSIRAAAGASGVVGKNAIKNADIGAMAGKAASKAQSAAGSAAKMAHEGAEVVADMPGVNQVYSAAKANYLANKGGSSAPFSTPLEKKAYFYDTIREESKRRSARRAEAIRKRSDNFFDNFTKDNISAKVSEAKNRYAKFKSDYATRAKNIDKYEQALNDLYKLKSEAYDPYTRDYLINPLEKKVKRAGKKLNDFDREYVSRVNSYQHQRAEKAAAKAAAKAEASGNGTSLSGVGGMIGKSLIGGAIGAGVGGIAGVASGADEDDTKALIATGALGGAAVGAVVGGFGKLGGKQIEKSVEKGAAKAGEAAGEAAEDAAKVAEDIAKTGVDGENSIIGGAKGLFNKAKNGADTLGTKIADYLNKDIEQEVTDEFNKRMAQNINSAKDTGNFADDIQKIRDNARKIFDDADINKRARLGNTVGGSFEGAAIGAGTGMVIGGIGGAIDDDETVGGGMIKGAVAGGLTGGIGAGILAHHYNNPALTQNIGSLFG